MKKRGLLLGAAVVLLAAGWALSADVTVTATIAPNAVPVGSQATLVVSVQGKFSKSSDPELPPLEDFTVYRAGTSQSFSFGTGGASSSLQFTYVLVPKKTGTFTIAPIQFRAGDKVYTADPVTIEVVQSSAPATVPESTEKSAPDEKADQPIFIRGTVDKDTVYVGQQLTWMLGFYTDGRLGLVRTPEYAPPDAQGFWAEELPSQKSYYKQIQGRKYLVNEVKRALFASAPGEYTIGAARVDLVIDDFGSRMSDRFFDDFFNRNFGAFGFGKPVSLKTRPISVTVLPLPAAGRPVDFSGLVGKGLEISAQADKNVAQVGEPVNLVLEVRGEGNFKTMSVPQFVQPDGFKMYESGTTSDVFKKEDVVAGRKKYEYVLIPQAEGSRTIPAVTVSYFDPSDRKYKTVRSSPIQLDVKPGTAEQGRRVVFSGSGQDIEVLGRDINYIHPVPAVIRPASRGFYESRAYVALHALPLLALIASIAIERRRQRFRGDVRLARSSRAASEAERRLSHAHRLLKEGRANEAYAAVSAAIRGYLADKMNASASGLTADAIDGFLAARGVAGDGVDSLRSILAACDGAQYSPAAADDTSGERARELADRAAGLIRILDKRYLS